MRSRWCSLPSPRATSGLSSAVSGALALSSGREPLARPTGGVTLAVASTGLVPGLVLGGALLVHDVGADRLVPRRLDGGRVDRVAAAPRGRHQVAAQGKGLTAVDLELVLLAGGLDPVVLRLGELVPRLDASPHGAVGGLPLLALCYQVEPLLVPRQRIVCRDLEVDVRTAVGPLAADHGDQLHVPHPIGVQQPQLPLSAANGRGCTGRLLLRPTSLGRPRRRRGARRHHRSSLLIPRNGGLALPTQLGQAGLELSPGRLLGQREVGPPADVLGRGVRNLSPVTGGELGAADPHLRAVLPGKTLHVTCGALIGLTHLHQLLRRPLLAGGIDTLGLLEPTFLLGDLVDVVLQLRGLLVRQLGDLLRRAGVLRLMGLPTALLDELELLHHAFAGVTVAEPAGADRLLAPRHDVAADLVLSGALDPPVLDLDAAAGAELVTEPVQPLVRVQAGQIVLLEVAQGGLGGLAGEILVGDSAALLRPEVVGRAPDGLGLFAVRRGQDLRAEAVLLPALTEEGVVAAADPVDVRQRPRGAHARHERPTAHLHLGVHAGVLHDVHMELAVLAPLDGLLAAEGVAVCDELRLGPGALLLPLGDDRVERLLHRLGVVRVHLVHPEGDDPVVHLVRLGLRHLRLDPLVRRLLTRVRLAPVLPHLEVGGLSGIVGLDVRGALLPLRPLGAVLDTKRTELGLGRLGAAVLPGLEQDAGKVVALLLLLEVGVQIRGGGGLDQLHGRHARTTTSTWASSPASIDRCSRTSVMRRSKFCTASTGITPSLPYFPAWCPRFTRWSFCVTTAEDARR